MIGRVIGQYRITEKLGEGGMGVVYRATDLSLRRDVALKFIREQSALDTDAHARLMAEARAAAALNHPNICTVYQVLEADDGSGEGHVPVLAMELVAGETLAARLEREGPLPIDVALRLAIEVADGLAEAHGQGVIHRDLKPHNVMTAGGRAKILDFGLSKPLRVEAFSDVTTQRAAWTGPQDLPGQVLGTVAYMAPEQALGRSTDARADVFSFGVMLYELVSGVRPFQGSESVETIAKIIAADFDPPSNLRRDLPGALDAVIKRCLQKNPADRYPSARELAADLRRAQVAPQITTGTAPALSQSARPRWLAVAAATLSLVVVAAIWFWPRGDATSRASQPVSYDQLTFVNDASYPAISRDGSLVAYVRGEPWGELFATAAARAPQKVVIHDSASGQVIDVAECRPCLQLQWSSDGSSLFVLTERGVSQFSRLGGLLREFPSDRRPPFLAVAPGGRAFATAHQAPGTIRITDTQTSGTSTIAVTGDHTSIRGIDWSPTADRLAVLVSNSEQRHIWTITRDGKAQTTVTEDVGPVNTIRWSAAGDEIYYLKVSGLSRDLWGVPVDPGAARASDSPKIVLGGLQAGPNFSLSADGRSIAYTRETRFANLWTASIAAGATGAIEPVSLTTGTHLDQYPSISPDGKLIAFVRSDARTSDVYIMSRAGGEARRVTFLETVFGAPAWSPDGGQVAFCAGKPGARRVWTMAATGGSATPLESTSCTALESEVPISWAPGREILYQRDGNRNYHRIDPATGRESALVADPSRGWFFGPRPHGRQIAAMWNEQDVRTGQRRRGLWMFGPDSAAERFLAAAVWPLAWSSDGATIIGFDDQTAAIVAVSVRDGRTRVLRTLQGRRVALLPSISPDLRSIVYSAHSILADVWVVRNFETR